MTSLASLARLILKHCEALDASCAQRGIAIPSLDDPYKPGADVVSVANRDDPVIIEAMTTITGATLRLLNTVRPAPLALYSLVTAGTVGAAARAATELHVSEALKDSGEKGLHINDIAAKCKTDPLKLGVILRLLASQFVFKEVRPDVFANNRLSSLLDKGQSVEELQAHPESKYTKPNAGLAATVVHFGDETLKMSAHFYESLISSSSNPCTSAYNKAFSSSDDNDTLWDFYERPEQKERHDRFKVMMAGAERVQGVEGISKGFDWASLPEGATVVDVGGGIGNISMRLAEKSPKLKIVCQDLPKTLEKATEHWKDKEEYALISSGRVSFQAHSFFDPQPIHNASIFFVKNVLHDWPDARCVEILASLRAAASAGTKLVVVEKVLPYTCLASPGDGGEGGEGEGVPEYFKPKLVAPLTNVGAATAGFPYVASMMMLLLANGQERTITHFVSLCKQSGWKIVRVGQGQGVSEALGMNVSVITAVSI